MSLPSPLGSFHADRAEIRALRAELAREVETRENANAVSVRVEAENRLLMEELELAAEQGRLVGLDAERYRRALETIRDHGTANGHKCWALHQGDCADVFQETARAALDG